MTVINRRRRATRDTRTNVQKRDEVLTFLNDPNLSQLSDRDLSRRTRVSQPFVSKLRKRVIRAESPNGGPGLITRTGGPETGRDEAIFDAPALSSHSWQAATPRDQGRFVDGVGLRALYDCAPQDHRDAFLASLLAEIPPPRRPANLPGNVGMYVERIEGRPSDDGMDIPPSFRRTRSEDGR
jgi:hypothetical protein